MLQSRGDPSFDRARPVDIRTTIPINSDKDIVRARQTVRELGGAWGMSAGDQTLIAAAVSELARNIVLYAKEGEIILERDDNGHGPGIIVVARDQGPGIPDIQKVIQGGYSTSGGLGLGLSGVRRLMDDFRIDSALEKGTTVTAKKWKRRVEPILPPRTIGEA